MTEDQSYPKHYASFCRELMDLIMNGGSLDSISLEIYDTLLGLTHMIDPQDLDHETFQPIEAIPDIIYDVAGKRIILPWNPPKAE